MRPTGLSLKKNIFLIRYKQNYTTLITVFCFCFFSLKTNYILFSIFVVYRRDCKIEWKRSTYNTSFVKMNMKMALSRAATGTVTTQAYTMFLKRPQSTPPCCFSPSADTPLEPQ
jgi:hypothetical protein